MARRKVRQGINFFSAPASQNAPSQKKQRNVGPELCSQSQPCREIQAVPCKSFQRQQSGRRVTAAAP